MAQPILTLRHRDGGTPAVFQVTGATPTQLGLDLPGSLEGTTGSPNEMFTPNRVIQFQGDIYAAMNDGVYKLNTGTGVWSNATIDGGHPFVLPSVGGASRWRGGLYYALIGNVPSIYCVYNTSEATDTWRGVTLNGNTGAWSETISQVALGIDPDRPKNREWVYRNVMYLGKLTVVGNSAFLSYDPNSGSFGVIGTDGNTQPFNGSHAGYCVLDDRLFATARNQSTGATGLWEFTGSTWDDSSIFDFGGAVDANEEKKTCLFTDGTSMYALYLQGGGWNCRQINMVAGVPTLGPDISATVLLPGLLAGRSTTERFWVFYDQDTNPGGAIRIQLFLSLSGNPLSTVTAYLWNGNAALITQEDVGASASFAWAENISYPGAGDRIFATNELDITITSIAGEIGGERISFKCFGGGTGRVALFRFDDENEVPNSQCTLAAGSVTGGSATLNGNQVENIAADGATVYSVRWDNTTDGINAGGRAQLVPFIKVAP